MSIQGSINQTIGSVAGILAVGKFINKETKTPTAKASKETVVTNDASAEQKANEQLTEKQTSIRKRRDFIKTIKDEPLYFGGQLIGTVGSTSKDFQKNLRAAVPKGEKTKIMNEVEERSKDGGK